MKKSPSIHIRTKSSKIVKVEPTKMEFSFASSRKRGVTLSASKSSTPGKRRNPFTEKENRRKGRHRPGEKVLRDIKTMPNFTGTVMQRAPFQRLVREVCEVVEEDLRWTSNALEVIQRAC